MPTTSAPPSDTHTESEAVAAVVQRLTAVLAAEDAELARMADEERQLQAAVAAAAYDRAELEARLEAEEEKAARSATVSKLLQIELTVTEQLFASLDSLLKVHDATDGTDEGRRKPGSYAAAIEEVEQLTRALKRQQQLVSHAHRQLLEISTKRKPIGVVGATPVSTDALRAALAEQEVARLMAEARSAQLEEQMQLMEEHALAGLLQRPDTRADGRAPPVSPPRAKIELRGGVPPLQLIEGRDTDP